MLNLASSTDDDWFERVQPSLDDILLDHAHCEKKAASTALGLIFRYQHRREMMTPLSELAREELEHFEQCLVLLEERGIVFQRQRPSGYASRLHSLVREREPEKLTDLLLIGALIEARSCERMRILSEELPDPALRNFYRDLLASEARHHMLYVDLAATYAPRDEVMARLEELAAHEAHVLATEAPVPRLHSAGLEKRTA